MTAPPRRASAHEVRIIGGAWRRSKLAVADSPGLRPTPDRVRETLFNWLGQDLSGWRCLDAFAGSGVLGFEAASRGATEVVLLEREHRLMRNLLGARERLDATQIRVQNADALAWMARCAPDSFELVFLDPPFDASLLAPAVEAAARIVVPHGFVYVESDHADARELPAAAGLATYREGRAGAVRFQLLRRVS